MERAKKDGEAESLILTGGRRHVVSCKALVRDQDDNIVVLRRSSTHPRSAHKPDVPGGIIDVGEQINQGLAREILEETGLLVDPSQLRLLYAFVDDSHEGVIIVRLLFTVTVEDVKPPVQLSSEHDKAEWLRFDAVREKLTNKTHVEALAYVAEHGLLDTSP
ncbi:NUDIX domain-containing protein [Candidatus Saccharibacteria bacterium]|nr:NUDIX domain-containing protein [Candidatus Saccharibacteria bacterium]